MKGLTPRELEVAALVAEGLCSKRIARRMGIFESSVKSHMHRIFGKLGVTNRTELAVAVLRAEIARMKAAYPLQEAAPA